MSQTDTFIAKAAGLPLKDAAFYLWNEKQNIDRLEFPRPIPIMGEDLSNQALFTRVIQATIRALLWERDTAHDGPTFDRLKRAHPEASDRKMKDAIKAAVKLDHDCMKNFSYQNGADHGVDVDRAIAKARKNNSEFSEATYDLIKWTMMTALR